MKNKILVYTNGEKIGDGIIKLPLIHEIKKRLPNHSVVWVTNTGETVYNNKLKFFANQYIDQIIEKAHLSPFFWKKISRKYDFNNESYDYILDTQKAVYRTLALKRIKSNFFISATANYMFSSRKLKKISKNKRKYYLDDLLDLLNLIKKDKIDKEFRIKIPIDLERQLKKIFNHNKYFGIAPGAGEKNKIWSLKNFIKVGKYFVDHNYKIVFYLGPNEKNFRKTLKSEFPFALFPEELISNYSNVETVMASTKFLSFALTNDSGISHMLSTNYCPLIKLFGPKESKKFTPKSNYIKSISSKEFNSKDVNKIPINYVINTINKFIY